MVARATKWLSNNTRGPFFLWVHLYDPHAPYGRSYDRAVAAADAALGKLIAMLRNQKLFEDSVLVVASDHGEGLGAHGEDMHGIFLYDETIHVPLLVKLPQNQMAGKRVKGRVRCTERFSAASFRVESVGVVARWKISLHPRAQAGTLRRVCGSASDEESRPDF